MSRECERCGIGVEPHRSVCRDCREWRLIESRKTCYVTPERVRVALDIAMGRVPEEGDQEA